MYVKYLKANLVIILCLLCIITNGQQTKTYQLTSPDGNIVVKVEAAAKMQWSVTHKGETIIVPSPVSLQLQSGEVMGDKASVSSAKTIAVNTTFNAINYKNCVVIFTMGSATKSFYNSFKNKILLQKAF